MAKVRGEKTYRRLGCEQAICRKFGGISFKEVSKLCEKEARRLGKDITFHDTAVQQFVSGNRDFSMKRLEILGSLLGVHNLMELNEVYVAPERRGCGELWKGSMGSTAKDYEIDTSNLYR